MYRRRVGKDDQHDDDVHRQMCNRNENSRPLLLLNVLELRDADP
jgi:hypothetical protein